MLLKCAPISSLPSNISTIYAEEGKTTWENSSLKSTDSVKQLRKTRTKCPLNRADVERDRSTIRVRKQRRQRNSEYIKDTLNNAKLSRFSMQICNTELEAKNLLLRTYWQSSFYNQLCILVSNILYCTGFSVRVCIF